MSETIPVIPEFLQVGMKLKLVKCGKEYVRFGTFDTGLVITITKVGDSFIDTSGDGVKFMFSKHKPFSNERRTWEVLCE